MSRARIVTLLLLAEVLSYRFVFDLGFYSDDWHHLWIMRNGLWDGIKTFSSSSGYWTRPVQILQFPLLYWIVGNNPAIGQVILCALGVLEGYLLYRVFQELTGEERLSALAAILAVLYPIRIATHVWISNTSQLIAHCLILWSILSSLQGRRIAAILGCILSGLTYESALFAPLVLLADKQPKRYWHYLPALAGVMAWSAYWTPKTIALSSAHMVDVYWYGLHAIFLAPVELIWWVGKTALISP